MDQPVILVTCTDDLIGASVLRQLQERYGDEMCIVEATSRPDQVGPDCRYFDWAHPKRSAETLREVDCVFFMQPASFSGLPNRFSTLLSAVPEGELPHVVYVSIMGAERGAGVSSHFRVENVIRRRAEKEPEEAPFTILRPSYLMQNIEEVFGSRIREKCQLVVPSGEAPFVWIDGEDVAEAAVEILVCPSLHAGQTYVLTGDVLGFRKVAQLLEKSMGRQVQYRSPNPVAYFAQLCVRERSGVRGPLSQTTRHYKEQFTATPRTSNDFEAITGRAPTSLHEYITRTFAM